MEILAVCCFDIDLQAARLRMQNKNETWWRCPSLIHARVRSMKGAHEWEMSAGLSMSQDSFVLTPTNGTKNP